MKKRENANPLLLPLIMLGIVAFYFPFYILLVALGLPAFLTIPVGIVAACIIGGFLDKRRSRED